MVSLARRGGGGGWFGGGFMAVPGTYTAHLAKVEAGVVTPLDEPIEFEVVPLREASIPGPSFDEMLAFQNELTSFNGINPIWPKTSKAYDSSKGHANGAWTCPSPFC